MFITYLTYLNKLHTWIFLRV